MIQLVSRKNNAIRLVGLEDAKVSEDGRYIRFKMPIGECLWSGSEWEVQDYNPASTAPRKKECPEFRAWLRKKIAEKGYSAYGLSMSMGYSSSWMGNFLNGKSRLRERDLPRLAKELGVSESYLRAKRARSATIRQDV